MFRQAGVVFLVAFFVTVSAQVIAQVTDYCGTQFPCQNGGTCMPSGTYYMCMCPEGYMGFNCEDSSSTTPCDAAPCQNGGTCTNIGTTSYACACPMDYSGTNCETYTPSTAGNTYCNTNPCQNGGNCETSGTYYKCNCPLGTSGYNCESVVATCNPDPCNGGTCTALTAGGYQCSNCPGRQYGAQCQFSAAVCSSTTCGVGTCTESGYHYLCDCPPGYAGINCGSVEDPCNVNPCENGGTCSSNGQQGTLYICSCATGFEGANCQTRSDTYCITVAPCLNGGTCEISGIWYTCTCAAGYGGYNCETKEDVSWGYEGLTGPEYWGEIGYPICSEGNRQSAIDITTAAITQVQPMLRFELTGDWELGLPLSITNDGHTVKATLNGRYSSTGGPLLSTVFLAEQFHFHWGVTNDKGSEHKVNGKAYPVEMHIVHYDSTRFNNVSEAANSNMGLALFGFFIDIGQDDNTAMQPIVQAISSGLEKGQVKDLQNPFILRSLLPMSLGRYWTYDGSLTTPPCYESVIWIVFETPITISQTQMNVFRTLGDSTSHPIINNYRPIVSTNQRPVIYNY